MSVVDRETSAAPALALPRVPERPLSLFQYLRVLRDNSLSTYRADVHVEDIAERRFLWKRAFFVNQPDAIKHILVDNAANYHKTEITRRLLEPGLGRGLLTSEDETWRRHRRIMAPAFDHRSILGYAPIITETAEKLAAEWRELAEGTEVDVANAMMRATLTIISRTMFSSDADEMIDVIERNAGRYQAEIRPGLSDMLELPHWLSRLIDGKRSGAAFSEFDRIIDRLMGMRGQAGSAQPKDLLARLIAARDSETGGGMTTQEVRNQVITIFMAGHETTALALTWTWYLLSQHPAAEAKLHAELDRVLGGRPPAHADLAALPFTRMVIDEAMRLYPPAHTLSRTAMVEDVVLGRRIPKGSTILIVPWLLHRNPRLWDRPERFEPERFAPERAQSRHRFAYIPFGAGPRICIGAAFALTEACLILATLGQHYGLALKPGFPVEPQGLITLRPRHGMRMLLARRR
ncbi:MAG TPA: cytochrome P450 [Stellaceae bacterium]|nr:cytochrome P450 [Stellaceae bacterium]